MPNLVPFLIKHMYLNGVWLDVATIKDIKKKYTCLNEIGLHAQNMIINILEGTVMTIS